MHGSAGESNSKLAKPLVSIPYLVLIQELPYQTKNGPDGSDFLSIWESVVRQHQERALVQWLLVLQLLLEG